MCNAILYCDISLTYYYNHNCNTNNHTNSCIGSGDDADDEDNL